jgi:hypothetical protein
LLDWSRSPLIAAYFALEDYIYESDYKLSDACIWMLEPHKLNKSQGFKEVTPSIESNMCRKIIEPAFEEDLAEEDKVIAVMASEYDSRMFVQQGCFTIHSYQDSLESLNESANFLTKIIIPSECVESMAREIDVCGFRKGDLFPDLANLSSELKGKNKSH